jgi:hypothetical protein
LPDPAAALAKRSCEPAHPAMREPDAPRDIPRRGQTIVERCIQYGFLAAVARPLKSAKRLPE